MPRRVADKIDQCIGANLKRLRRGKKLSRPELGAALQTPLTPQALMGYEDGSTRVPAAAMVELARLLGCRLTDLFEGVEALLPSGIVPIEDNPAVANLTKAMAIDLAKGKKSVD